MHFVEIRNNYLAVCVLIEGSGCSPRVLEYVQIGGTAVLRVWPKLGNSAKALWNKGQHRHTQRESETCRFQDGL